MTYSAKRVDDNQTDIVNAFRSLGATVLILSSVGKGCPDIMIGIFGKNYLIEIKDGKKPPSARKLTEAEAEFHQKWKGQVDIITSLDDVLNFMKKIRQ